jgi:hypothetical protein
MRSGQATIQMKTNVLEIASDESPAVSEYANRDPEMHLAQERAMEMDLFNSLQKKHLQTIA